MNVAYVLKYSMLDTDHRYYGETYALRKTVNCVEKTDFIVSFS